MGRNNSIGKTIILLFLIVILILAGLMWFDYLGVIQAKSFFAPVYKIFGMQVQDSKTATSTSPLEADLDNDRFLKRLESLDLRTEELNKRENDLAQAEALSQQTAQELEDRRIAQEERELTFNNSVNKYESRITNVIANVSNLNNMPPKNAVDILVAMEDQDIIDILRMADEIAAEQGVMSMASTWLQMMPAERAAQIQRKMLSKPRATTDKE
ncbi:MAG: flagellar protein FlbB [Spirochaetaceae bacterium]|nr:flagellar protein FlbB [Spirochaetaceae bacterium]